MVFGSDQSFWKLWWRDQIDNLFWKNTIWMKVKQMQLPYVLIQHGVMFLQISLWGKITYNRAFFSHYITPERRGLFRNWIVLCVVKEFLTFYGTWRCMPWSPTIGYQGLFIQYTQLLSISGGRLLRPQYENPQCHGVREQINTLFST